MSKHAAMPTGVTIAGLGARAVVSVLDVVPLALLGVVVSLAVQNQSSTVALVVWTVASMLGLGWLVFLWWGYATRGQSPAARWLRIRVLRLADGRPLGWGRWFLRALVWYATMIVPVVWLLLVVLMLLEPRRRGWHDLAGRSVVVAAKAPVVPAAEFRPAPRPAVASANMVSLPAHLMAPQTPYVAEQARDEREDTQRIEPITALPNFTGSAPAVDSSSFAPSGPPIADALRVGAQPPAAQHVYPNQVPYNPPAAYLQQPPNPYAAQQPVPSPQPSANPYVQQPPASSAQPSANPYVQPRPVGSYVEQEPPAPSAQSLAPYAAQQPSPQESTPYPPQPTPYPPQPTPYPPQPESYPPQPESYAAQPMSYSPQPESYAPPQRASYPPVPQGPPFSAAAAVPPHPQRMIVAEDEDLTRTHLAPVGKAPGPVRKATDGWQLRLDDGRMVPVSGLVLIGRSPRPKPDEQAELVQAGVESRMVSKTHLAVGLDHRGLYVMDRGSTNGTAIANSGGQFEPCAPGDPVRVREGQIVSFGDRYLEVRREAQ